MMKVRLQDSVAVSSTRITTEGYLIADAHTVRTGIQLYRGKEVDPENKHGLRDKEVVRVYRSAKEVRDDDSLQTFSHAPVTIGHPKELVDSKNWKDLSVGEVSTDAVWDGERIRLPLILKDQKAIGLVAAGKNQLSASYTSVLKFGDGVTPEGEPYDVEQTQIRVNHVAIVDRARAGDDFQIRLSDGSSEESWGAAPIQIADTKEELMSLRTIMVDGLQVQTTDAGAAAIEKLQTQLRDAQSAKEKDDEEKAKKLAKVEAERDDLKAKADKMNDAAIDARVAERGDLVAKARSIVKDAAYEGLSDATIRRNVVVAKLGDAVVKDKSDEYIAARFDMLADEAAKRKPDAVLSNLQDTATVLADGGWGEVSKRNGFAKQ